MDDGLHAHKHINELFILSFQVYSIDTDVTWLTIGSTIVIHSFATGETQL